MKMTFRPLDNVSFRIHDNWTNKNVLKCILKIQTSSPFLVGLQRFSLFYRETYFNTN